MAKIKYLIVAIILLPTLWGCEKDKPDYAIGIDDNVFAVNPVAIPVESEGGTYELTISGTAAWTAELTNSNSSAEDWCVLSETSGTGKKVITVTVKPSNSFVKHRSVIIEVTSTGKTLKSKVLQEKTISNSTLSCLSGSLARLSR